MTKSSLREAVSDLMEVWSAAARAAAAAARGSRKSGGSKQQQRSAMMKAYRTAGGKARGVSSQRIAGGKIIRPNTLDPRRLSTRQMGQLLGTEVRRGEHSRSSLRRQLRKAGSKSRKNGSTNGLSADDRRTLRAKTFKKQVGSSTLTKAKLGASSRALGKALDKSMRHPTRYKKIATKYNQLQKEIRRREARGER
jgi:hypothetical protein